MMAGRLGCETFVQAGLGMEVCFPGEKLSVVQLVLPLKLSPCFGSCLHLGNLQHLPTPCDGARVLAPESCRSASF